MLTFLVVLQCTHLSNLAGISGIHKCFGVKIKCIGHMSDLTSNTLTILRSPINFCSFFEFNILCTTMNKLRKYIDIIGLNYITSLPKCVY